jgi:uncharacterized membrane protein YidH (DUF202 family)
MTYQCPRCGDPVSRNYNRTAQMAGGLVGAMVVAAFGSFGCKKCGKIARGEFPAEVRNRMMLGSVGLIVGALVLFVVVIGVIAALR